MHIRIALLQLCPLFLSESILSRVHTRQRPPFLFSCFTAYSSSPDCNAKTLPDRFNTVFGFFLSFINLTVAIKFRGVIIKKQLRAAMTPQIASDLLNQISPARIEAGREAEFFKMIDQALDVGVAILDENMTYRYMGEGMMEQLGLPPNTLKVGDSLKDCHDAMVKYGILPKNIFEDSRISTQKNTNGEVQRDADYIHEFSNGRKIQLVRKKLANGYLVSMSFDVTALVEKDDILEESLRLGSAGYWTYDFKTKKYKLSKTLQNYFGPKILQQINTQGIASTIHKDDRHMFTDALKKLSENNYIFDITCRTNRGKGDGEYSRSIGKIHRDANGKPDAIRTFVKDITKEHSQAKALERAKDEAIAASHAKSQFLANMSHEIRTPMNGVLGMAELLSNSNINEQQREFVKVINDSATALLTIINDILDFSKIEAGALELDPTSFDLRDTICDVVSLLSCKAKEKNLEIIVNYPTSLPNRFIGDAGRLRQVVMNLIGNAVKFTDKGHIIIEVNIVSAGRSTDKGMVTVNVKDTGIGIENQKIDSVFQKFTQADGSTTRNYGGTGLGLSISKKIIELMNGRMHVSSTFGSGSTFSFTVPLSQERNQQAPAYDTSVVSGKRVLIVDDIHVNRQIMSQQVNTLNMRVATCDNGVDALTELINAQRLNDAYDLILMDYLMPSLDGKELSAMISANEHLHNTPIIMLSSCDQPLSSEDFAKIGVRSFLMKPVREARLAQTVISVLSEHIQSPIVTPKSLQNVETDTIKIIQRVDRKEEKVEILVAEDFQLNQDVVRLMLIDSQFKPIFANNGAEAVSMFSAEPDRFALVLMDVSMPVMDGYEATGRINDYNEENNRPHTPIIALTGHALKHDRQNCLDAGMDDFLVKPVQQSKLLETLKKYNSISKGEFQKIA